MGVRQRKHPLGFPAGVAFAFQQTLDRLEPDEKGCLNWPGPFHGNYGRVFSVAAHRIAWSVGNGNQPNPFGLEVDHLCRNTHCVNYRHLELVTKAENVRRMAKRSTSTTTTTGSTMTSESNESQKPLDFDLRTRIWRTLEAHGLGWIDNGKPDAHCLCGHVPRLGESWHFHVADAVIAEIGNEIAPQYHYLMPDGSDPGFTDWKADDE